LGTFLGAAGILGIALGFAVKDSVENFIASVMLSLRQPFRPNDLVEIDGDLGRVIRLTSRATILLSVDGNHIRIPNSTVFKARIVNFSENAERRFQFDLGVDAEADLARVRDVGLGALGGLGFVLDRPAPAVWVEGVGDSNVVIRFAAWVDQTKTDFALARGEAIRIVKCAVEAAGFGLPEPIYRVRLDQEQPTAPPPAAIAPAERPVDARNSAELEAIVESERRDKGAPDLLNEAAPKE
jgi:small-conductance mechanosensitive channel